MSLRNGIYIITGIMASGKSTVAQLLAEQFEKGVHVRGDIFRRMIVSGRAEMTPEHSQLAFEQLTLRYRIAAEVAQMYFDAGFSVVVQDNYLGKNAQIFIGQFESKPAYLITLNPSVDAVKERERTRNKKGYTSWDVESLHDALVNENPRIGLWIDSTHMTPEETVAEIVKRAEAEARIL
ncbi:MAG: AAA family ATPase [Eubacteriales bacterium]|jgi:chloramphenicol 3-O-phosphotransferase